MAISSVGGGSMAAAFAAGQESIRRGTERFSDASEKIVRTLSPEAMVDSKLARVQTEAGIAVLRQADEMRGQLIDDLG